jgi:THUMP domain-like/RNA cap guanine-N2 methyltransferase
MARPGVHKRGRGRDDGPMSQAAELLTPAGDELLGRLRGLEVTPELALRLAAELRGQYPAGLVAAALTQQSLRVAAREKFSRAADMYFTRAGLEQASAEQTATHSAARFARLARAADLCCGIGGDLSALASVARQVLAVDADLETLAFAMRNVAVSGASGRVAPVCADVRDLDLAGIEAAFIDPARRAGGRRLRTGDSEPPLDWCFALAAQVPLVCVKAAPGLPRDLVPGGWEAEFVAVGRALKEALLWSPGFATTTQRATVLPARDAGVTSAGVLPVTGAGESRLTGAAGSLVTGSTLVAGDSPRAPVAEPGEYLLDPNPAITRAGLVADLARELGAWQIDPMIAFLSLDRPASTPFARTLRILESMPWHEREAARKLRELGIGAADIRRRGLAGDVQQIHRRLALQGDKSAMIVLTRRNDQPWCLICEPVQLPAGQ